MKTLTPEQAKKMFAGEKYKIEQIETAERLAAELAPFTPATVEIKVNGEDGFDSAVVYATKDKTVQVSRDWDGYIRFFIAWPTQRKFKWLGRYERERLEARLPQLKKMKVPTLKKVSEAIEHEKALLELCKEANAATEAKVAAFLANIKAEVEANGWKLAQTETGGEINVNGLVFTYEIASDGYIKQEIKIDVFAERNLDTFKKLTTAK